MLLIFDLHHGFDSVSKKDNKSRYEKRKIWPYSNQRGYNQDYIINKYKKPDIDEICVFIKDKIEAIEGDIFLINKLHLELYLILILIIGAIADLLLSILIVYLIRIIFHC